MPPPEEFPIFLDLITELRLLVWRFALPNLPTHALYTYNKGPNPAMPFESLTLDFETSRLLPLSFPLPLLSINDEARDVALKFLRSQQLTARKVSDLEQQGEENVARWQAQRSFNHSTDITLLRTQDIEDFLTETSDSDILPNPWTAFSTRIAMTRSGLEIFSKSVREFWCECLPLETIYVLDVQELEPGVRDECLELANLDSYRARFVWKGLPQGEFEASGDEAAIERIADAVAAMTDQLLECWPDTRFEIRLVELLRK